MSEEMKRAILDLVYPVGIIIGLNFYDLNSETFDIHKETGEWVHAKDVVARKFGGKWEEIYQLEERDEDDIFQCEYVTFYKRIE